MQAILKQTVHDPPERKAQQTSHTAGTYTASANGNNGPVTVEVDFSDSAITAVRVTEHAETAGISDTPIERIPAAIVMGGIQTQVTGEVLDIYGNVIPGLYACGEASNGAIYDRGYISGTSVLNCYVGGRDAGSSAAAYAK